MARFIFKDKDFYLDGTKYPLFSGAMHYFRIPRVHWRDRLLKLRECGFNTVETYTCWNLHEKNEGEFDFSGELDVGHFLDLAKEVGLNVILRPGPYICAEWEFGGFPAWLLSYKDIRLRCDDELYLSKVKNYFSRLFEIITPRLIENGGNILMLQIENEYGSYGNDTEYLQKLADMYEDLGANALCFTSDGVLAFLLNAGTLKNRLCFLNFGSNAEERIKLLEDYRPNQPLVCAEFWCGWFDRWYGERQSRACQEMIAESERYIKNGIGFNLYMFHGGTNFGFMNGANGVNGQYFPTITSYDYGALLSEAGDRTEAYYGVRDLFIKYGYDVPALTAKETEKASYGKVVFTESANLFDNVAQIGKSINSKWPLKMEEVGQNYGYILYSSYLVDDIENVSLDILGLADRAIIFVDGKKLGTYERSRENQQLYVSTGKNAHSRIDVLVENMGRINYGPNLIDRKGMDSVVLHRIQNVLNWTNTSFEMNDLSDLIYDGAAEPTDIPTFYKGYVEVDEPKDTFIKPSGFTKGFITVNGFNIGRYYNPAGPQKTLYVPKSALKKGRNEIVIFESDGMLLPEAEFVECPEW